MKLLKYTLEELEQAVKNSFSIRQTLKKLNINPSGGNYKTINKAIKWFNINNSHFTGKGHLKGKTHNYGTRPLEKVLVLSKEENTYQLKNRLLKEGLKLHQCENCFLIEWLEVKIPLELHHVDGNRLNNQLVNLQLLCPNCHALTKNYRGKNQERFKKSTI